jgi:hypothetical protein
MNRTVSISEIERETNETEASKKFQPKTFLTCFPYRGR